MNFEKESLMVYDNLPIFKSAMRLAVHL